MIGHHTRLRENDDLPVWRGPAVKKKPPFSNAPALITREIMRSRDAQYSTGECWGMTLRVNTYKNRPKSPVNGTSRKVDFACILFIDRS